jgi:hypothetical protein
MVNGLPAMADAIIADMISGLPALWAARPMSADPSCQNDHSSPNSHYPADGALLL